MKALLYMVCLAFALGCQKRESMQSVIWEKGDGARPVIPEDLKTEIISVPTKVGTVKRYVQKWGEAEVDNSFLHVLKSKKNEFMYMKMNFSKTSSPDLLRKIDRMGKDKGVFLEKAKKAFPELRKASFISPVKIMVSSVSSLPKLYYQLDILSSEGTGVVRWRMTSPFQILDKIQVSSCYDGQGMAFPNGPHWSQVEEVLLPNLVDDGTLKNPKLNVQTHSGTPAISTQQVFFFKPDDPRFDQVQVFYYANKMIQQFKTRLGVDLPFNVELKTHVGYPDKKTAMFYYDHRIHLGQGDEVGYKDVLKDPTIVMHETAHAFVEALAGLPQGSLNEAFADFFTTSFLDHPLLGEVSYLKGPYTRSVDNQLTFKDKKETVYGDSQIVSGALWEIRKQIGVEKAELLALKTLIRLGPDTEFDKIGKNIKSVIQSDFTELEKAKILKVLELRLFPLEDV